MLFVEFGGGLWCEFVHFTALGFLKLFWVFSGVGGGLFGVFGGVGRGLFLVFVGVTGGFEDFWDSKSENL